MNAVTQSAQSHRITRVTEEVGRDAMIKVLQNSLYPGARPESIEMVLAWCRATGRDPMKKPIHIVPMWVKDATTDQGALRDVLMPGIGTYRTDAATSGQYAGKGEPEFGPDVTRKVGSVEMTYPAWCRVTVQKIVGGAVRDFTAKEFWLENYATAGRGKSEPNAMWTKRPYGQIAKCAESQALRMAFPDETGNTNTAEEMEGKTFEGMTVDLKPEPAKQIEQRERTVDRMAGSAIPSMDQPEPRRSVREILREALFVAPSRDEVAAAAAIPSVAKILRDGPDDQRKVLQDMIDAAWARFEYDDENDGQEQDEPAEEQQ